MTFDSVMLLVLALLLLGINAQQYQTNQLLLDLTDVADDLAEKQEDDLRDGDEWKYR